MDQLQDEDMFLFGGEYAQAATPPSNQMFDEFLYSSPMKPQNADSPAYLNPSQLTAGPTTGTTSTTFDPRPQHMKVSGSPAASSSSSSEGSGDSPAFDDRKFSINSTDSASQRGHPQWQTGIHGMKMPASDGYDGDADMSGLSMDPDVESSNQQMAAAFDFDTAASTPSAIPSVPAGSAQQMLSQHTNGSFTANNIRPKGGAPVQFFFGTSRETSPMNAMLPMQGQSPWAKQSPSSSGLEEPFHGMAVNGDSPGNATFSPNLQMNGHAFSIDGSSAGTPSTFAKDVSSPPSTAPSIEGTSVLTVWPTSLKSRVETQIPIRMTLHPLPQGVSRLKLPTHTVSKPKFLAKPSPERSPDILELHTSLVCSSAMQDPKKLQRAFARARGEDVSSMSRPSPASSNASQSSKDDEDKPLNGGEVRICAGCIQRERKRASRKKQKKPDEEQLFQRDEERRVVVFNTNELKEWVDPTKEAQKGSTGSQFDSQETYPLGAMQVELPMRIACYCRHHNEKLGFQVIFTIKDCNDKVIAQNITNTIMITDDHKTHNPPPSMPSTSGALPNGAQVPSSALFTTAGIEASQNNARIFKQSLSTTDLQGLQHNFNPQFPMATSANPFAVPSSTSTTTSGTMTPRNLSRPPSPSAISGPNTKRRKQSAGKLPSNLQMTRMDVSSTSNNQPATNSATSASFPHSSIAGPTDRGFAMPNSRPGQFGTSPPTPNGNENGFMAPVNRSFSMENLSRQGMISAPSSRQPSRPSSPVPMEKPPPNQIPQAMNNQMYGNHGRRPAPLIHKLVPAEGSVLGGTEVTLLGNGFYQGLEVMFGDTEATTTTYWGEKCLNCITPPAIQHGTVPVMFKHEHPQYSQGPSHSQTRQSIFTYVDDREVELYRLALKTLGRRLQTPTDDPYSAARQLLHGSGSSIWGMQSGFGSASGQQRQVNGMMSTFGDAMDIETNMLAFLQYLDSRGPPALITLDMQRPTGHTLLHLASSMGMTRFVAGLLARGASPNVLDNNGNTPMHLAAMFGHSHIVHRLRLAGGDHKIRSMRNFLPADLATSLLAHQASMLPNHHYRSRSAGGTPMRLHSRNNSASSLRSFWETASVESTYFDGSDESDEDDFGERLSDLSLTGSPSVDRRRPSGQGDLNRVASLYALSRQGSGPAMQPQPQIAVQQAVDEQPPLVSPAAYMLAWRDQLAAQIQQYQQSVNWALPNLPALPSLPTMPDFAQDHPMVRRVSSLFPHRAESRPATASSGRDGWWGSLTGSTPSSPPAYDELFPNQETEADFDVKKASAVRAAGDAAADLHYEALDAKATASSSSQTSQRPVTQSVPEIRRREVMQLKSDTKLFLIWIPLLVLVLGLMINNAIPDIWRALEKAKQIYSDLRSQRAIKAA